MTRRRMTTNRCRRDVIVSCPATSSVASSNHSASIDARFAKKYRRTTDVIFVFLASRLRGIAITSQFLSISRVRMDELGQCFYAALSRFVAFFRHPLDFISRCFLSLLIRSDLFVRVCVCLRTILLP